jgi:addiction module RelE/StbE family toxin
VEKIKYLIEYDVAIEEKLRILSKPIREMIRRAIENKLVMNPVAFGKPLRYSLKGYRRLRVGDYRIVYKIHEEKVIVLIVDIGHRKDIYGKD